MLPTREIGIPAADGRRPPPLIEGAGPEIGTGGGAEEKVLAGVAVVIGVVVVAVVLACC